MMSPKHIISGSSDSTLCYQQAPARLDISITYQHLTFEADVHSTILHLKIQDGTTTTTPILPCPNLRQFDDPIQWSRTRKNIMTWLSCAVTVTAAYSAGSYESPADELTKKWGVSLVAYNVGITAFTVGFGVAPMVLAPFSEEYGRRPVFITTGVLFVVCQLCCALTSSYGGMLAARFFLGVGGSTFSTMVGGILADIWAASERNTPMTIFTGAALFGTGFGPLVSGYVTQNISWRWVFYIQTITGGLLITLVALFFKETRGSIILSRKAKVLNRWYDDLESVGYINHEIPLPVNSSPQKLDQRQRIRWKVQPDEDRASLANMISTSLVRPFHLLFTESVVFWFSLWVAFSWAILYLQFGSIPLVFQQKYSFSLEQTGAVFTAVCVGSILSTVLSIYQEHLALRFFPERFSSSPEARLYFACIESTLMPVGLFWFGWTSFSSIPWIVPTIGITLATMGIFSIYLSTFNYLADCYHIYASSALAAQSLCRNLLGGVFPLLTVQMFNGLGYPEASSLLGGLAVALTAVPWALVLFGTKIRLRSKFVSQGHVG